MLVSSWSSGVPGRPRRARSFERLERSGDRHLGLSHRSGIGTWLPDRGRSSAGCRGVTGPVPQPLWMSACRRRQLRRAAPAPGAPDRFGPGEPSSAPWRRPRSSDPCPGASSRRRRLVARRPSRPTISVCLPARNEEATVGHIVATVRRTLMEARAARRRGRGDRRRLHRRHRGGRGLGGRPRPRGRRRPPRDCPGARARATRCGSRSTRATATSSAGSTPTSATSAPHFVTGCSARCSPIPTSRS